MKTRKELMALIDQQPDSPVRAIAHVLLGAYELEAAQTDADRLAILDCIAHRVTNAKAAIKTRLEEWAGVDAP